MKLWKYEVYKWPIIGHIPVQSAQPLTKASCSPCPSLALSLYCNHSIRWLDTQCDQITFPKSNHVSELSLFSEWQIQPIRVQARPRSYPGLIFFLPQIYLFLLLKHTEHLATSHYCSHPIQATIIFTWLIIITSYPCSLFLYLLTVCTHRTVRRSILKTRSGCFVHYILAVGWLPCLSRVNIFKLPSASMLLHLRSLADFFFFFFEK